VATGRRARSPGRVRGAAPFGVGVAVSGVLLGLAVASGALYVSSIGSALLARDLDPVGGEGAVVFDVRTGGTPTAAELELAEATLLEEARGRALPDPELQLLLTDLVTKGPVLEPAEATSLEARRGREDTDPELQLYLGDLVSEGPAFELAVAVLGLPGAEDHMQPVVDQAEVDADLPTAAITAYTAAILGVGAGDELELEAGDTSVLVAVDRVVEDYVWGSIPGFWQPVSYYLAPNPDPTPGLPPPPPSLLVDTEVARELHAALDLERRIEAADDGTRTAFSGGGLAEATFRVRLDGLPTLDEMRRIAPAVEGLLGEVVSAQTELGGRFRVLNRYLEQTSAPVVGGQVGPVVDRVELAVAGLRVPVLALGTLGQLLALVVLGAAVVTAGRTRLARARLWAVRGVSPLRLGSVWAAAALVPLAVGMAVGWWAAPVAVAAIGEGRVDRTAHLAVWPQLVLTAATALLVVATTVTVAARRRAATDRTARSLPPVAEVVAVLVLAAAVVQVRGRDTFVAVDGAGGVSLDLLAVTLPLALVASAAVLGTRILRVVAAHLARDATTGGNWWYLATRRLRSLGGASAALAVVSATSLGVLVAASALASSAEATVEEKTRVAIGADGTVPLPRSDEGRQRLDLEQLTVGSTEVLFIPQVLLGERTEVDVLAIDPGTFAEVAYEPTALDRAVDALVAQLTGSIDGAATAIAVGDVRGGTSSVSVEGIAFPVVPVERVDTFPGATGERPLLVVARDAFLDPDDRATALRIAFATDPALWLAGDVTDPAAEAAVERAGLDVHQLVAARTEIDDPGTAPLAWTFVFLRAQAAVLAVLGILALVADHVARRRSQALATALARRMGLGRAARYAADGLELGLLLGASVLLGSGSGLLAARAVLPQYDPLPQIALPSVFAAPTELVPVLAVAIVGLTLGAVVVTARAVDRTDVATLLRSQP
jgi:hypothetical protein